nr:transposase [uncultured Roseovarius sp.]
MPRAAQTLLWHPAERRLCEEVDLNLAYRWFCRLDLTDRISEARAIHRETYESVRDFAR